MLADGVIQGSQIGNFQAAFRGQVKQGYGDPPKCKHGVWKSRTARGVAATSRPRGRRARNRVRLLFCGQSRDDAEPITVAAIWEESGEQREQYWGAHRACLIEHMSDYTRSFGGPLTGD